jgi:hypothetical protein
VSHPCCRIPPLPLDAPVVLTALGSFRPERAIVYNRPFLLLHHYASGQPKGDFPLSEAVMAGLHKTASRLWVLLTKLDAVDCFTPLWWEQPEGIGFHLDGRDPAAAAAKGSSHLQQAERLETRTLAGETVLEFWRC